MLPLADAAESPPSSDSPSQSTVPAAQELDSLRPASPAEDPTRTGDSQVRAPTVPVEVRRPATDNFGSGTEDRPSRLADVIPDFLAFAAAIDRAPHTIETIRIDLALLQEFLGNVPVAGVGLDDLRRYVAWLRQERKNDPRSLRRKVASAKAFFRYLQQEGFRADNPAESLIYPALQLHLPEFLEDDEAERLIAAADRPLWRALIVTLLDTGLKRDEILALHPADVYLDSDHPERSYLTIRATSQARRVRARTLSLTSRAAIALARQIETGAEDRVFPVSVRAVNAIVEQCAKRAGIRKRGTVSPQMLRDTFAIRELRRRLRREEEARQAGASEREILSLQVRHDQDLCDLLGLAPLGMNNPIQRFRLLVAADQPRRR